MAETIASRTIHRPVHIDKTIQVTISLRPVFTIQGLRVGNPKGFNSKDFPRMNKTRLQIGIFPLLAMKIHGDDFSVDSLELFLEQRQDKVNQPFAASMEAASLKEFLDHNRSWTRTLTWGDILTWMIYWPTETATLTFQPIPKISRPAYWTSGL